MLKNVKLWDVWSIQCLETIQLKLLPGFHFSDSHICLVASIYMSFFLIVQILPKCPLLWEGISGHQSNVDFVTQVTLDSIFFLHLFKIYVLLLTQSHYSIQDPQISEIIYYFSPLEYTLYKWKNFIFSFFYHLVSQVFRILLGTLEVLKNSCSVNEWDGFLWVNMRNWSYYFASFYFVST